MIKRPIIPIVGALLAALAAIALIALVAWNQLGGDGTGAASAPGEVVVAPGISVGGPFELVDHTGAVVTQESLLGRYTLVYFGYTFCPDVCPTELAAMAAAMDILAESDPEVAAQVTPMFITIDPARDTQPIIKDYVAAFHPDLVGLTGDAAAIDAIAKNYRVYYAKGAMIGDGDYLMNHSGFLYLMGPDGGFRAMLKGGSAPDVIAEALSRHVNAGPTS